MPSTLDPLLSLLASLERLRDIKTVHQRFLADGRLLMLSDVSYPKDRYDSFVFTMALQPSS